MSTRERAIEAARAYVDDGSFETLDPDLLAAAFSDRTKAILLNNPMNPAARVFTADELALIADLVIRHDAYVIADEVYEHLVFDGGKHIPVLSIDGLRDRARRSKQSFTRQSRHPTGLGLGAGICQRNVDDDAA